MTWDNPLLVARPPPRRLGLANEDVVRLDDAGRRSSCRSGSSRAGGRRGRSDLGYGRRPRAGSAPGSGSTRSRVRSPRPWLRRGASLTKPGARTRSRRPRTTAPWRAAPSCARRRWPSFNRRRPLARRRARTRMPGNPHKRQGARRLRRLHRGSAALLALGAAPLRQGPAVGDGDRPERLHRLQRLRGRLPEREQHPRSSATSRSRRGARCTGCASTATSPARPGQPGGGVPARALHAVRERALRAGLPGGGHRARRRRPERDGLQPLHRHPLLLEQLPLQGAPLQLLQLHQGHARAAQAGGQPGRHRALARRDGEVHLLRAADPRAKIDAKLAGRALRDGDVQTACQQACPTQAIAFGDIRDPRAGSRRRKADPRDYVLLAELGNKPRTSYLARSATRTRTSRAPGPTRRLARREGERPVA